MIRQHQFVQLMQAVRHTANDGNASSVAVLEQMADALEAHDTFMQQAVGSAPIAPPMPPAPVTAPSRHVAPVAYPAPDVFVALQHALQVGAAHLSLDAALLAGVLVQSHKTQDLWRFCAEHRLDPHVFHTERCMLISRGCDAFLQRLVAFDYLGKVPQVQLPYSAAQEAHGPATDADLDAQNLRDAAQGTA